MDPLDDDDLGLIEEEDYYDEPEEPREPDTWTRYDLHTNGDGSISGTAGTNDDNDDGYPDSQLSTWKSRHKNKAEMLHFTGGTHQGILSKVYVYLDGQLVDREGNPIQD